VPPGSSDDRRRDARALEPIDLAPEDGQPLFDKCQTVRDPLRAQTLVARVDEGSRHQILDEKRLEAEQSSSAC
jgi:hypothetical protein